MTIGTVQGYRQLSAGEIEYINMVKAAEAHIAEVWLLLKNHEVLGADQYWLRIARTHLEEGCSAMVRSIARPESPFEMKE